MSILKAFTRGFSAGITLLRAHVHGILPGLYVTNARKNSPKTPLIYDGDFPNVNPEAHEEQLDLLGNMFDLERKPGERDNEFRRRILFSIGKSSTRSGILRSLSHLFSTYGIDADIDVAESFSHTLDATSTSLDAPIRTPSGTFLFGVSITIAPKSYDASTPVLDADGNILYRRVRVFNMSTFVHDEIRLAPGVEWRRVKSPYFDRLLAAFRAESFRSLVSDLSAAGIKVDSVTVREPGAGGSR